tara:strand:- start:79 stop:420 length:342 start_codon:yes stop_codon:yes gene_type:complete
MHRNGTDPYVEAIISGLEVKLEDARGMPEWAIAIIAMVCTICFLVTLQVMLLVFATPCIAAYKIWQDRQAERRNQLLDANAVRSEQVVESEQELPPARAGTPANEMMGDVAIE